MADTESKDLAIQLTSTPPDIRDERLEKMIHRCGWEAIAKGLQEVLSDDDLGETAWIAAAEILWGAILDGLSVDVDKTIALLYWRLDPNGDSEDNLVWSIASKLKRVGYLSNYEPFADPVVRKYLAQLRSGERF